jgi:hypothetical protein
VGIRVCSCEGKQIPSGGIQGDGEESAFEVQNREMSGGAWNMGEKDVGLGTMRYIETNAWLMRQRS